MKTIQVKASKSYEVKIGSDILKKITEVIRKNQKVAIVTDETVALLHLEKLKSILAEAGFEAEVFMFPSGEESKCIQVLSCLLEWLAQIQMTRSDMLIAFGGGVTGDLAGFAASIYLRGIEFIQVPTTFLAAIDSSVGGKTGIDLQAGKNLAGSFWQPKEVICDLSLLDTLSEEIFAQGTAEAIKAAILTDYDMFEMIRKGKIREDLEEIIYRCVSMKRDLVEEDEFDTGQRQLLNLGHTFGHCVEKLSDFGITHGDAVAIGLALIMKAASVYGHCTKEDAKAVIEALNENGLDTECPYKAKEMLEVMKRDKKRKGDHLTLILPRKIGECFLQTMSLEEAGKYLEAGLQGGVV
jgi:3-dehydroquinate synthase